MIRKSVLMKLKPGKAREYRRRHNPIWPELHHDLKAAGISNYSIFCQEETDLLFAYMEVESEEKLKKLQTSAVFKRWRLEMKDLLAGGDEAAAGEEILSEVFHID